MANVTYPGLYIGNLADMDTNESINGNENAFSVLGNKSFGTSAKPLYADSTRLTLNDTNNDNLISYNQTTSSTDSVSYRLNDQNYNVRVDTTAVVDGCTMVQRLDDGSTRTVNNVTLRIMQDVNGNAFLVPPRSATGTEAEVVKHPIISITMSNNSGNYGGGTSGTLSTIRDNLIAFRDGYVDGTDGNDLINGSYVADVDGDRVDNNDAILPGTTGNDDVIRAGAGNDTVDAGAGADSVRGGDGNDSLSGHFGPTADDNASDTLEGGAGSD